MSLFGRLLNWGLNLVGVKWRFGINLNKMETSAETEDIPSIIYSCCDTLAKNLARMPLRTYVEDKAGKHHYPTHRLYNLLKFAPNGYQNPYNFWRTIEYHRNYYGNGFSKIHRNGATGYIKQLELIHPTRVEDAIIVNDSLYYRVRKIDREGNIVSETELVNSHNMLHFTAVSEDGFFGISPVYASRQETQLNKDISGTLSNTYKNGAHGTLALQSEIGDTRSYKALKEAQADFEEKYAGPQNAGRLINLPPNSKLVSIPQNFNDLKLIDTKRFTKEEIANCFAIPLYMLGDSRAMNPEASSLTFRNYTMAPIVRMYRSELEYKLLTPQERNRKITIEFDMDVLVEMDYKSKVGSIKEQVVNGLMTPNEGAMRLGNSKIEGEWGDKHYVQAQYIPLEQYEKYNPLLKDDPTLKTDPDKEGNEPVINKQDKDGIQKTGEK